MKEEGEEKTGGPGWCCNYCKETRYRQMFE